MVKRCASMPLGGAARSASSAILRVISVLKSASTTRTDVGWLAYWAMSAPSAHGSEPFFNVIKDCRHAINGELNV